MQKCAFLLSSCEFSISQADPHTITKMPIFYTLHRNIFFRKDVIFDEER